MYEIKINQSGDDVREYVKTKNEVVAFIARTLGLSKRSLTAQINAKSDSQIYIDNQSYRIYVWFNSHA